MVPDNQGQHSLAGARTRLEAFAASFERTGSSWIWTGVWPTVDASADAWRLSVNSAITDGEVIVPPVDRRKASATRVTLKVAIFLGGRLKRLSRRFDGFPADTLILCDHLRAHQEHQGSDLHAQ